MLGFHIKLNVDKSSIWWCYVFTSCKSC